jgi:hypothetical protein
MRLLLPNLKWAAQHIMNDEIDADVMNVLYGAQTYDENFHKVGLTPQIVEQLLAERGFTKFIWDYENYHMFVRAFKIDPGDKLQQLGCVTQVGEGKVGVVYGDSIHAVGTDPQEIMKEDLAKGNGHAVDAAIDQKIVEMGGLQEIAT